NADLFSQPSLLKFTEGANIRFVSTSCQPCEEGWTAHRGKCYFFSSKKQTWFESRDLCNSNKVNVLHQDFLVSKIKETHWIGLNDLETEGHWVWMNKNCASLGNFDGFLNEWFDNSCRMQKKFICEKKNTFPLIDDI
uniref:C-type lectin domain-containing protein n=1 Tax=Sinocyclocheilus anshuiensis TaxID=1608454 RepID=A0A671NYV6_9TELE